MEQVYPEPVVGLFIFNDSGRLLLVKSPKWEGFCSVPGGHIELGETIEDAAKREAKEEVGLDVKLENVLMVQDAVYPEGFSGKKHFIFIECICRSNGDVNIDNKEIVGFEWIYPEKALELDNLGRFARKVINRYIETKTIDSSRKKNLL